ncbi:unnamed protein product, partial [Boreogadus saida]
LESQTVLTPENVDQVNHLALSWDLPNLTENNRRLLGQQILHHGVIVRRERQMAQLRKGLKDTRVLQMLKERPELASALFPRSAEAELEPESNMLLYWEQERTRPFPGPLFKKQDNPGTYYLDQGFRHSVSLVCIQSTAPAPLPSNASLPATDPLPSNAPLPTVTETFLKDHTLFLIDLMRLQLEAEGRGPPRSLQDLSQRLKLARNSKKLLWEEIAGKLTDHFKCTFPPDKVARKWNTLVEAYKKVKDHNSSTGRGPGKFQFYTEMDDLMGGHHDIVFPVVGTAMGLDVRRPGALQVSVSAPDAPPSSSTSAVAPAQSGTPSPPPSSRGAPRTATTMPPANTPRRPRKRQREEDPFLRESEAASQAAAQKRHAETLAQMKEAQEGLQSMLGQMVEKM